MKVVGSLQTRSHPLDAGQRSEKREAAAAGSRGGMPTKFCSGTARCDNHKHAEPQEPVKQCKEFVVIGKRLWDTEVIILTMLLLR